MAAKSEATRNKLLARIHILKKELGMDDPAYREALRGGWNVDSAKHLNEAELLQVVKAFAARLPQGKRREYPGRPANMGPMRPREAREEAALLDGRTARLQKIEALLTEAGRPWAYADALARNICKVEKVTWVPEEELYKIITPLMKDAKKHGRDLG